MTGATRCWSPRAAPKRSPPRIMGLAGPGDEVVLIEPAYDSYRPIAEAAGATVKAVTLAPPDFRLTDAMLAAAITPQHPRGDDQLAAQSHRPGVRRRDEMEAHRAGGDAKATPM